MTRAYKRRISNEIIMGTKTDLWTTNVIGEGLFNRAVR